MDVQTIQENLQQQNILLADIQYQHFWAFGHVENKHNLCRREDCMNKFCESLREIVKKNITVSKKIAKVTSRCKSILHLQ